MRSRTIACAAASLATVVTAPAFADEGVTAGLAACQAIADQSERLACYDELAESSTPVAPPAPPAPSPVAESAPAMAAVAEAVPDTVPAPTPAPQPLTDEVAKQEIKGSDIDRPEYAATVTRCEELKQQRRMFFFMDNGQVWKQSNAGRLNFKAKDCKFDVTLKKDMFGWILHVPTENERVRVKRVR